jgi:hypothetical protein
VWDVGGGGVYGGFVKSLEKMRVWSNGLRGWEGTSEGGCNSCYKNSFDTLPLLFSTCIYKNMFAGINLFSSCGIVLYLALPADI